MRRAGHMALIRFPQVDLAPGKPRPVLLIGPVPGPYEDWLVCMVSTQLHQALAGFDEVINREASDFQHSGIKVASVVRVARPDTKAFALRVIRFVSTWSPFATK